MDEDTFMTTIRYYNSRINYFTNAISNLDKTGSLYYGLKNKMENNIKYYQNEIKQLEELYPEHLL